MKKIFFILSTVIFSIHITAKDIHYILKEHPDKYCVKMQDGRLTVVHEGSAINSDVTLSNGIIIQIDGTILKKDGSKVELKEGECIDKDGKVTEENSKKKSGMEKSKKSDN